MSEKGTEYISQSKCENLKHFKCKTEINLDESESLSN